jgi:fructose transport system permease protein
LALSLSLLAFGTIADTVFTTFNFSLITRQMTVIGFLGIAQTPVILTAGIDLSVAAVMMPACVVMGRLGVTMGLPLPIALPARFAAATAAGFLNGFLVTGLRPPPFIVTLGAWPMFFALTLRYSDAQTVRSQNIDAVAPLLKMWGERIAIFGAQFTTGSFLMGALFGLFWRLLNWTQWGRAVYAIGDDKDAAELAGIRTDKVLLSVCMTKGPICAVGGWVAIGRLGSVSPQSFYEGSLDAITAVVIGGPSLFGGHGSIFGTLIGALIARAVRLGLKLSGVEVFWHEFTVGTLIIIAVAPDQWVRKASS